MKKFNRHGSVFTLLLRNYILMTLFLALLLTALFIGLFQNMGGIMSKIDPSQITDYNQLLAEQHYEDFPIERLLGSNGGILVLDGQCKPLYQGGEPMQLPALMAEDVACIPVYGASPEIIRQKIHTTGGESQTSISITEYRNGEEVFLTYILDAENHLLYQPGNLPMDKLTVQQSLLLSDSFSDTYSIQKHSFKTKGGSEYTLLLAGDHDRAETADAIVRAVYTFLLLFLVAYCTMALMFILFLNQRIKKPLRLLCLQLNNFESGENQPAVYHGPKEFTEIFDSFNSLSQRLRHSEEERTRLEVGRQKMLTDISHDLKTPITVIQGYAKALHDGVIPPDQQVQYLEIIEQKAAGLNELMNTFYEYSKMEHPDYMLKLVPGDICNTLRDYIADRYAELEMSGFMVDADIPERCVLCNMDTMALLRAFDNIVNNCIKHNPKGTTLSVSLTSDGGQVRILWKDNGVGIPAELRAVIFYPFVVGEASRSNHGSGLGLSITQKIIEAHHGTIQLMEPTPSSGTGYEILLPAI